MKEVMSKKVLIIEDDPDIRASIQDALEVLGVPALEANDGQQALTLLSKIDPPGLILLDLMMPIMNGWEFRVEQVKNPLIAAIPVVIISADVNLEKKALSMGAVEVLKKPFDFDSLARLVKRYCG